LLFSFYGLWSHWQKPRLRGWPDPALGAPYHFSRKTPPFYQIRRPAIAPRANLFAHCNRPVGPEGRFPLARSTLKNRQKWTKKKPGSKPGLLHDGLLSA